MSDLWSKILQLPAWESLMKRLVLTQLGDIRGKKILDFGSGMGVIACYYAQYNEVTAVEPNEESVNNRWRDFEYTQLTGSTECLREMEDALFDVIICHNVFEYAPDREDITREFARLLKPDGFLSICKHNRAGRVMQMVILLDNFDEAGKLLAGGDSVSAKFGTIHYYEDEDIERWCDELEITKVSGMRTFWDLQQNQEIHTDPVWQQKMIEMELSVSDLDEYKKIAFLHHVIVRKKER